MLIVEVTGHTVVVVYVTTVTVDSGGIDEPPAGTEALELTGKVPEGTAVDVTGEPGEEAGEVAGRLPLGLGPAGVDSPGVEAAGVVSVTGHTVVETAMVEVTTEVESAGQLVTVGAQLVTVISLVVYTVEVVHLGGTLAAGVVDPTAGGVPAGEVAATDEGTGTPGTDEPEGAEGTDGLVG